VHLYKMNIASSGICGNHKKHCTSGNEVGTTAWYTEEVRTQMM